MTVKKKDLTEGYLEKASRPVWWGKVWNDFILDNQNREVVGQAVWLYLYLTLHANRQSGRLRRKYITIATDMFVSPKTVQRWMSMLRKSGHIKTTRLVTALDIEIVGYNRELDYERTSYDEDF